MKKKSILNRAMFRQVKSPAYGTGIASNLVSNEQRQRYNSGGRVGLGFGTPWKDFRWDQPPGFQEVWKGRGSGGWKETEKAKSNLNRMLEYAEPFGEWTGTARQPPEYIYSPAVEESQVGPVISPSGSQHPIPELPLQYGVKISGVDDDLEAQDVYQGSDPRYFKPTHQGVFVDETDVGENQPYNQDDIIVKEDTEVIDIPPHIRRETKFDPVIEDTDTKPDPFKTLLAELDESSEKKKQYGRGKGMMEGAAAAIKWGHAPTAEKRGEAIAEGLTKVGETGMKAATEGMDLKDRVKILKAMEDVKGGHKMDVWESKFNNYYKKALEISGAELDFKKLTAKLLKEELPPKKIYKSYAGKGILGDREKHGEILSMLLETNIPVATTANQVKLYSSLDNNGLIFIDLDNNIQRNTNGKLDTVNVWKDKEFFGE